MSGETPKTEAVKADGLLDISVVTTAFNEAGNVEAFLDGSLQALKELGLRGEMVFIDDGSMDGTSAAVRDYHARHPEAIIRLLRRPEKRGITAAMQLGFKEARGRFTCLIPSDRESLPERDIALLWRGLTDDCDIVLGYRSGRGDGKVFASKVYNLLNGVLFGVRAKDANWIKLMRTELLKDLKLRSDWHRFLLPILVHKGARICEVETPWNKRTYGKSNFGLKRFPVSLADMMTVKFQLEFDQRPMLFFLGTAVFFGLLCVLSIALAALADAEQIKYWVVLAILACGFFVAGITSLGLGFVSETVLQYGRVDETEVLIREGSE